MLGALGYDSSYWLPGVIRVGAERFGPAVARYGGDLEKMLQHLDESAKKVSGSGVSVEKGSDGGSE